MKTRSRCRGLVTVYLCPPPPILSPGFSLAQEVGYISTLINHSYHHHCEPNGRNPNWTTSARALSVASLRVSSLNSRNRLNVRPTFLCVNSFILSCSQRVAVKCAYYLRHVCSFTCPHVTNPNHWTVFMKFVTGPVSVQFVETLQFSLKSDNSNGQCITRTWRPTRDSARFSNRNVHISR
jgi:hypothetical protein